MLREKLNSAESEDSDSSIAEPKGPILAIDTCLLSWRGKCFTNMQSTRSTQRRQLQAFVSIDFLILAKMCTQNKQKYTQCPLGLEYVLGAGPVTQWLSLHTLLYQPRVRRFRSRVWTQHCSSSQAVVTSQANQRKIGTDVSSATTFLTKKTKQKQKRICAWINSQNPQSTQNTVKMLNASNPYNCHLANALSQVFYVLY